MKVIERKDSYMLIAETAFESQIIIAISEIISSIPYNGRRLGGVINDNGCFSEDSGESFYNYQAIPKSFYPEYKKLTLGEINDVLLGIYINLEEV